ncbi:MAG: hypothetical protein II942_02635 [Alphaproteobacteria bacterium]|nr:hypothetical protein [Alphaproteobacteria bacterium]
MTKTFYKDRLVKQLEDYVPATDGGHAKTEQELAAEWLAKLELVGLQQAFEQYIGEGQGLNKEQSQKWLAKTTEDILKDKRNFEPILRQYKRRTPFAEEILIDQQRESFMTGWKLQDQARREDPVRYEAGMKRLAELRAKGRR